MKPLLSVKHTAMILSLLAFAVALLGRHLPAQPTATEARFDLNALSISSSPFPSDWYTLPDNRNKTHLRINLPKPPECQALITQEQTPSICEDIGVLNELDGFNLMPRLSIPFSGPIDPNTVNSSSVFMVSLGTAGFGEDYMPRGTVMGINQVVWDPRAKKKPLTSDQVLAQHTRFALIVTRKVLDTDGVPVATSEAFRQFRGTIRDDYKLALLEGIQAARQAGVREEDVAVASVFTTQSATAVLEKIRDRIHDAAKPPAPATFLLGPEDYRTVFSLDQVADITWYQQTGDNPPAFSTKIIGLSSIRNDNVAGIAYGKYRSPDYLVHPYQYIPAVGTHSGTPEVREWKELYFNLYLPSATKPINGWPVAIFVHGIEGNKEETALSVVTSMAKHGIATITINDVGSGFGPQSTLNVSLNGVTNPVTLAAGGRGLYGMQAAAPKRIVLFSDSYRQTAADLMQLVRVIEVGMDVDGDGRPDVDPARIYLLPHSLGSGIGTLFFAVEPDVRVGVIDVPFDPVPASVLSCKWRFSAGAFLMSQQPSLLNPTGTPRISGLDGCPLLSKPFFDDNFPLRDAIPLTVQLTLGTAISTRISQSPVTNTVPGAMTIQEELERVKWVSQAGSPLAYAPHLRKAPLKGMSPKTLLFLMAKGDQAAPNPSNAAIVRAGDLADRTLYYRHDLYYADNHVAQPMPDKNPHGFAVSFGDISEGVQEMIGQFFASDGNTLTFPEPRKYFEFPIVELPESLNYSSIQ